MHALLMGLRSPSGTPPGCIVGRGKCFPGVSLRSTPRLLSDTPLVYALDLEKMDKLEREQEMFTCFIAFCLPVKLYYLNEPYYTWKGIGKQEEEFGVRLGALNRLYLSFSVKSGYSLFPSAETTDSKHFPFEENGARSGSRRTML